jgi:chitinase
MNYDVWGSWSATVGPNAPLNDTCAPSAASQGSAVSALDAWTAASFPASQILLGVASYGHSFHVAAADALSLTSSGSNTLALYSAFDKTQQPAGDAWDSTATGVDSCGNANEVGGVFDLWGLISGGFLKPDGTAADGIDYVFDNCSQTPFVYNPNSEVMVSFDDATSFGAHRMSSDGLPGCSHCVRSCEGQIYRGYGPRGLLDVGSWRRLKRYTARCYLERYRNRQNPVLGSG